jgi:predicted nucleotidyltransferase
VPWPLVPQHHEFRACGGRPGSGCPAGQLQLGLTQDPARVTICSVATPRKQAPELELVGRALARAGSVDLALVFGSFARGEERADSDLDVAVYGAAPDVLALSALITRETGREAHVVRLQEASIPLLESLIDDGIVVHEGRPGAAASWRARVLIDLELDRPWYARQRDAWLKQVQERGL